MYIHVYYAHVYIHIHLTNLDKLVDIPPKHSNTGYRNRGGNWLNTTVGPKCKVSLSLYSFQVELVPHIVLTHCGIRNILMP